MKSQFDIHFTSRGTQLIITNYTGYKLNRKFQNIRVNLNFSSMFLVPYILVTYMFN
jgi:hypothetical protein